MPLKESTNEKPNQRAFEGLIGLTRPENNDIEIELPQELKSEKGGMKFKLACTKPTNEQRLHVLVIGVNVQDREKLRGQVLSILSSNPVIVVDFSFFQVVSYSLPPTVSFSVPSPTLSIVTLFAFKLAAEIAS